MVADKEHVDSAAGDSAAGDPAPTSGDMLLIQFTRAPVPGRVKTRMIPALSDWEACELHRDLLLWTCRQLCAVEAAQVELWVAGDPGDPVFSKCREMGVHTIRRQCGADLGERMCHALADGLQRFRKVILVGSDCPSIDDNYLFEASDALASNPVVLGPADDGGYVLLGVTALFRDLFAGISWGQGSVYAETIGVLNDLGVGWHALDSLPDIDRPSDLPIWLAINDGP